MSDPCLLAASLLTQGQQPDCSPQALLTERHEPQQKKDTQNPTPTLEISPPEFSQGSWPAVKTAPMSLPTERPIKNPNLVLAQSSIPLSQFASSRPEPSRNLIAFSSTVRSRPVSGSQLYQQRLAALEAGQTYTRLAADSFAYAWSNGGEQPTYEDWKWLLEQEANALAKGQGSNRLSVILGDSLSLWFPSEGLPSGRLWLNQGISGDTTEGILNRLYSLEATNPETIYLMAGINDLRRGESDQNLLWNLRQIVRQLRQNHPESQIVLQSLLPTRFAAIPSSRIRRLNQQIAAIAQQEGANYMDLYPYFSDETGNLRRDLTTDGLHLNPRGYGVWQWALQESESWIALNQIR